MSSCLICNNTMRQCEPWRMRCPKCRFEQSNLSSGAGRGVDGIETLRHKNFQTIIEHLRKHKDLKDLKCLEIGPAEGWFMDAIKKEGADIQAIEASEQAIELQERGLNVTHGFFPEILNKEDHYDLIIFNDVFEHLPDPKGAIKSCEQHLNKNGLLILNLPNSQGIFYQISKFLNAVGMQKPFERLWQKEFPSPHLTYFSHKNLTPFVGKHTKLEKIEDFYLPSLIKDGLKNRIQSSYEGAASQIIYIALTCMLPFLKILPQDIMVFIFKK